MKVALLFAIIAAHAAATNAQQPAPFSHGDAKAGKTLVERDCVACHEQKFKPATAIYTRPERRVTSAPQLLTQVQVCNTELRAGYFPEDEENVAAFLNDTYYKFKP